MILFRRNSIFNTGAAEEVGALERGGNKVINAIFESKLAWDHPRPDSNSDMTAREKFCFEKYVNRKFYSSTAASKSLSKSKPISSRLFGIKAPKGKSSSRKIASFMSASSSSGDEFGDDDGLGYGDATPDSDTNGLGYGDAAPDSERQRPRQRRSRRRASISVPSEQQPQMDRDNARPDSEQPTPPHQGRRAGRRSSLGISSTPRSSGSNEAGRRKPGKRTPNGKSPSLGQSIDTSRSSENREKSPSRRGGNTSLNESQHSSTTSSARKNTRRRGSVSGNTSTLRVAKSTSNDNLDDGFVW
jgi:hypothetical protein